MVPRHVGGGFERAENDREHPPGAPNHADDGFESPSSFVMFLLVHTFSGDGYVANGWGWMATPWAQRLADGDFWKIENGSSWSPRASGQIHDGGGSDSGEVERALCPCQVGEI